MKALFIRNQNLADEICEEAGVSFNAHYDGPSSFEEGSGFYIIRDGNADGSPSRDLVYKTSNGTVIGWLSLTEEQENDLLK